MSTDHEPVEVNGALAPFATDFRKAMSESGHISTTVWPRGDSLRWWAESLLKAYDEQSVGSGPLFRMAVPQQTDTSHVRPED